MFKEITIGDKSFGFLATASTSYRYKQVFHEDLLVSLTDEKQILINTIELSHKLGFIMNMQAEKADMNKLSYDNFLEWLDQFDMRDMYGSVPDQIIEIYIGNQMSMSIPKKKAEQQKEG